MRVSQLFGTTLRTAPAEELVSHQLLLRAGFIQQLASGIFSFLPTGWRVESKIRQILREEMNRIGGQELAMPVVHPGELWQRSGRWDSVDQALVRFQDRRGRDMVLAMTHEEVVAELTATHVSSYRDLPRIVYQLQTKFRDEPRARGGLVRTREFVMKDAYSLDRDDEGLRKSYLAHFRAYFRIAARVDLPVVAVLSDVGLMGGHGAHEFTYLTEVGEDTLVLCDGCGYAANREVASARLPEAEADALGELEEVETPGATTVSQVAQLLGVEPARIAKSIAYMAQLVRGQAEVPVLAVVPGESEVNLVRLRNAVAAVELRLATEPEIAEIGGAAGYISPRGLDDRVRVVADEVLRRRRNLVTGANRAGWHLRNFNIERDARVDAFASLAEARTGDPCPSCGEPLSLRRGIEYGNIFQLGTRYSSLLGASFTDEEGHQQPVVMGSYGIGVGRLLACIAEEHRDDRGLALPISVAPYQVALIEVRGEGREDGSIAERVYRELLAAGIEVLYDDRDARPGVKFADADLRGIPLRVTVSPRALAAGGVELKRREGEPRVVALEEALAAVGDELRLIREELELAVERRLAPVEALVLRTFGTGQA